MSVSSPKGGDGAPYLCHHRKGVTLADFAAPLCRHARVRPSAERGPRIHAFAEKGVDGRPSPAMTMSGRRGWNAEYVLGLSDGASLDIMGSAAAAEHAVPQILRALHGHELAFNAGRVSRYCGFPNAALLRERP